MKIHLTSAAVFLILSIATSAPAQLSYAPGTSGSGGFVPMLSSGQAWMGNGAFTLNISNATGGATAFVGASFQPGNMLFGNATVWIDTNPANTLFITPLTLSGATGASGAGSATLPYPINLPVIPALAGLKLYAQALIDDGGGIFAATNAIEVELTMPPRILVGTSVGGSNDPVYVVDPTTPSLFRQFNGSGIPAPINNVTDAEFAHSGRRAYFGQSIGNAVQELNLETAPPSWSTFYAASASTYGIGIDHDNDRLYTLDGSGTSAELYAIDCDLTSPAYGQVIASTTGLAQAAGYVERWELSKDGKQAAVIAFFSRQLILVDTDPASPGYMNSTIAGIIPTGPAVFPLPTGVDFSPDGMQVIVSIQTGGGAPGEIARYDRLLGQWIDHNASVPGTQNIGASSLPVAQVPAAPWEPTWSPDGTYAVVTGWGGQGGLMKIGLDIGNPFLWSATNIVAPVPLGGQNGAWANAISADSQQIATVANGQLLIFDRSGLFFGQVTLPGAGNVYTVTWDHN